MKYLSTRGGEPVSAATAILRGICPRGGLYVPETFPQLNVQDLLPLAGDYPALAAHIMSPYFPEVSETRLRELTGLAYASFDTPDVVPLVSLGANETVMELWHGPTMAFKDVALQMLPYLMRESMRLNNEEKQIYILVATSGDTGKAALEGFADVKGTRILVYYPAGGVSEAQRLQMVTQEGGNVDVCGVVGNFDDAQTGVKRIFTNPEIADELERRGYRLSSANSINFGRLLPQIVYYFASYLRLAAEGKINCGEEINFCVPTGNFGNILAGYYAKRMGLPVAKFICASNRNNVLTDFMQTGGYNANRPFYKSMSCSIDILISSNLERLLFELNGRDTAATEAMMRGLKENGSYAITDDMLAQLRGLYAADWCDETDTHNTIRDTFMGHRYLLDPHTAVAQTVYARYAAGTGDATRTVVLSTANPYKFSTGVLRAFEDGGEDDFANAARLHEVTNVPVPPQLLALRGKPERHTDVVQINELERRTLAPL
ncbi:MAG: threonine synthase [Clostridiales bacterium]|nr:threonine synthase [Clostridiales bacterium]